MHGSVGHLCHMASKGQKKMTQSLGVSHGFTGFLTQLFGRTFGVPWHQAEHIKPLEICQWNGKSCSPCRHEWPREKTSIQGKTVTAETKHELLWVVEMVRPEHCLNLSPNWNVWSLGEVARENPPTGGWETEHMWVLLLQVSFCGSKHGGCMVSGWFDLSVLCVGLCVVGSLVGQVC